jgi:magnesium-protoporphyrin IX monomethyl ester (oxidative) cyclase
MRDRYGISNFQGTEYIFDYRYFDSLLPRLKEINGHFRFEVKANLKPEQFQAFVDSGTLEVQPGVESLNDQLLSLLKKGTTAYQNILLLKRAQQVGLLVYWNLLYGIPGDQDEWYGEMADLLPLLHHLQAPAGVAQVHYDRFSPYWRDPAAHGLTLLPAYGYEYVYPFPPEVLKDIAYFFETPRQREAFFRIHRMEHAGLLRLLGAAGSWKTAWSRQGETPRLVAEERDGSIFFEDTRVVATARQFVVDGLAARIYRAAEASVVPANLVARLQAQDPSVAAAEIDAALSHLMELKVLALVSGRWLSLGLNAPVPAFVADTLIVPKAEGNPGWARLMADVDLDGRRPNLALECLRQPENEALDAWLAQPAHS